MSRPVSDSISPTLFRAFLILGLVGAGAAAWLSFAPISGAVIAEGRFKVSPIVTIAETPIRSFYVTDPNGVLVEFIER